MYSVWPWPEKEIHFWTKKETIVISFHIILKLFISFAVTINWIYEIYGYKYTFNRVTIFIIKNSLDILHITYVIFLLYTFYAPNFPFKFCFECSNKLSPIHDYIIHVFYAFAKKIHFQKSRNKVGNK